MGTSVDEMSTERGKEYLDSKLPLPLGVLHMSFYW